MVFWIRDEINDDSFYHRHENGNRSCNHRVYSLHDSCRAVTGAASNCERDSCGIPTRGTITLTISADNKEKYGVRFRH